MKSKRYVCVPNIRLKNLQTIVEDLKKAKILLSKYVNSKAITYTHNDSLLYLITCLLSNVVSIFETTQQPNLYCYIKTKTWYLTVHCRVLLVTSSFVVISFQGITDVSVMKLFVTSTAVNFVHSFCEFFTSFSNPNRRKTSFLLPVSG